MSGNVIGRHWQGFINIRHLVIFGDSYSSVGYDEVTSKYPTPERPLGVEFPGFGYMEPGTANWVGHLITTHANHPLLVYDFAGGGDDVLGVRKQVQVRFLPRIGEKPQWAPWGDSDTLFATWIGINDCAKCADEVSIKMSIVQLFQEQEHLYKAGARNFLFIDVPPITRTPIGQAMIRLNAEADTGVYKSWNSELRESIARFSTAHPEITTFFFSSWDTFTRVLDDPVSHGFKKDDVVKNGGNIWVDHLHPSTKMHDWIAHDLSDLLISQPPYNEVGKAFEGVE